VELPKNAIKNTQRGLYVNLPKETHCYFFTDNRKLQGTLVSSLPFTEPAQVPRIVAFLKKQALFYTLLASCVREQQKQYNGKLRASIFFHFLENTSFRLSNSMQTWTAL